MKDIKAVYKAAKSKKESPKDHHDDEREDKKVPKRSATKFINSISKAKRDDGDDKVMSKSKAAKEARKGDDMGKKGKNFDKIANKAGKEYGSKEAGEKVAGAVFQKLRKSGRL